MSFKTMQGLVWWTVGVTVVQMLSGCSKLEIDPVDPSVSDGKTQSSKNSISSAPQGADSLNSSSSNSSSSASVSPNPLSGSEIHSIVQLSSGGWAVAARDNYIYFIDSSGSLMASRIVGEAMPPRFHPQSESLIAFRDGGLGFLSAGGTLSFFQDDGTLIRSLSGYSALVSGQGSSNSLAIAIRSAGSEEFQIEYFDGHGNSQRQVQGVRDFYEIKNGNTWIRMRHLVQLLEPNGTAVPDCSLSSADAGDVFFNEKYAVVLSSLAPPSQQLRLLTLAAQGCQSMNLIIPNSIASQAATLHTQIRGAYSFGMEGHRGIAVLFHERKTHVLPIGPRHSVNADEENLRLAFFSAQGTLIHSETLLQEEGRSFGVNRISAVEYSNGNLAILNRLYVANDLNRPLALSSPVPGTHALSIEPVLSSNGQSSVSEIGYQVALETQAGQYHLSIVNSNGQSRNIAFPAGDLRSMSVGPFISSHGMLMIVEANFRLRLLDLTTLNHSVWTLPQSSPLEQSNSVTTQVALSDGSFAVGTRNGEIFVIRPDGSTQIRVQTGLPAP